MQISNAPFSFFSPEAIHYGRGQSQQTATLAKTFGTNVLVVHGSKVSRAEWLISSCSDLGLSVTTIGCGHEPSLLDIEAALTELSDVTPDVVIALGGGSVMDFAKALSALIRCKSSPSDYLEVVGVGRPLDHAPIPMIALPTTAGTGAEVTKNAVISVPDRGLKVSLRDPRMIPRIAIVDPALMQGAPKRVVLSASLDAVTQVIEPFLCTKANAMTDALCQTAIPAGLRHLREVVEHDSAPAWDVMSWVSTYGGLALANSGLGAVHGLAGVIGGKTNAPHGEICGALLPTVLASHEAKVKEAGKSSVAERLKAVLSLIDENFGAGQPGAGIAGLKQWSKEQGLRGLGEMGLSSEDFSEVAAAGLNASSMKANPFPVSEPDLIQIMHAAQ